MSATNQNISYPGCKAKNRRRSVDSHTQNWAVTVLLSLLRIKVAITFGMHNSDQITVQLQYVQDQKLLTLHSHSFECIVHSTSGAIDNCFYHDLT